MKRLLTILLLIAAAGIFAGCSRTEMRTGEDRSLQPGPIGQPDDHKHESLWMKIHGQT